MPIHTDKYCKRNEKMSLFLPIKIFEMDQMTSKQRMKQRPIKSFFKVLARPLKHNQIDSSQSRSLKDTKDYYLSSKQLKKSTKAKNYYF